MKTFYYFLFVFSLINLSCAKEEVDPNNYRKKGEVQDNTIYLRDHTTMLTDEMKPEILTISDNEIVVKEGQISDKTVGDVLVNIADGSSADSVSFFRKIKGIKTQGNTTVYLTETATWNEAYEKWTFDSRSDKFTIKSRSLNLEENFEINATSFAKISGDHHVIPQFSVDISFDDYYFTSFFDSAAIANANDVGDINPAFHLHFENLKIEMSGNVTFGASVSLGKDIEFGEPAQIFIIPETGLSLYFQPKMGYSVNLEGEITTPTLSGVFGGYDIDLIYNVWDELPQFTVLNHPPSQEDQDNPGWQISGTGEIELQGGSDIFVGITGAPNTIKAGVYLYNYIQPGISHKGSLSNLQPEYDLTFQYGAGINFFFGFPIVEDFLDFSWSSDDYKYPLWNYVFQDFPCPAFSEALLNFNRNTGVFDLRVGSQDRPLGFYNISVNDDAIANLGNPDFGYNTLYNLNTALPNDPINKLIIADKNLVGCYLEDQYVDPAGFGECSETVTDAQGNEYCTVNIGQLKWMAENLRRTDFGAAYPNESVGEDRLYGRLYTFEEILNGSNGVSTRIQGLCPNGWHLPTIAEWNDLINGLGGQAQAGKNIKYPSTSLWPAASLPSVGSFNAVSAGEHYSWRGLGADAFGNRRKIARFWTTQVDANTDGILIVEVTGKDRIAEQNVSNADPYFFHSVREAGYSCRCVEDY
ncbi:MAG: hypothetical protein IPN72_23160 [Saprospiraceae bacterium]|nr:hypothetical protein [Saprospiraceae bacterium]